MSKHAGRPQGSPLLMAGIGLALALALSCTSDIETAEDILAQLGKSSSSGTESSSSAEPSGAVFCMFPNGVCSGPIALDACNFLDGNIVQSCGTASSSPSSAAVPLSSSVVVAPSSSSAAALSSSPSVDPSSSSAVLSSSPSVAPSSSSAVLSSSSALPSSSSTPPPSSSSSVQVSEPNPNVVYGEPVYYGGETYQTVVIGTQTWFARNLNYAVDGSKCYGNDPANCETYGSLYDWAMAMAVCPNGWHLPSRAEWNALSSFVQSQSHCYNCDAYVLKTELGWYNDGNGTDDYGFSALPGGCGYGNSNGSFLEVGNYGYWWSASEDESNSDKAFNRSMNSSVVTLYGYNSKSLLFSVRCIGN